MLCPRESYQPWHSEALVIVADALGIVLQKEQALIQNTNVLLQSFARDLILGAIKNRENLLKWMSITGLSIKGDFSLIAVKQKNKKHIQLQPYIQSRLQSKSLPVVMYSADNILYILVYNQGQPFSSSIVMKEIFTLTQSLEVICGVSRRFTDLIKIDIFREQALASLEAGYLLNTEQSVFLYDDFYLQIVLSYPLKCMHQENCIHPGIFYLDSYDSENHTDYLKTLKSYITSMCNTAAACQELHIHRNTLPYRLNKIKDLTGVDCHLSSTCAELLFSFYFMDIKCKENK